MTFCRRAIRTTRRTSITDLQSRGGLATVSSRSLDEKGRRSWCLGNWMDGQRHADRLRPPIASRSPYRRARQAGCRYRRASVAHLFGNREELLGRLPADPEGPRSVPDGHRATEALSYAEKSLAEPVPKSMRSPSLHAPDARPVDLRGRLRPQGLSGRDRGPHIVSDSTIRIVGSHDTIRAAAFGRYQRRAVFPFWRLGCT